MEREADRTGLALMGEAGFAPAGMAAMFDKLDQSARLNDSGGFPYLRSHPLTIERVGEARQMVQSTAGGALAERNAAMQPSLGHALMQARARVMMDPSAQAMRRLQDLDKRGAMPALSPADRLVGLYTGALASTQLREFDRADQDAAAAQGVLAEIGAAVDPVARQALGHLALRLALVRKDKARAAQAQAGLGTAARADVLVRAESALSDGQPAGLQNSAEALQTWVSEHRDDATAWLLLSQTSQQLGQRLRALRADAESQAALGNLPGAIDRLRAGQQLARKDSAASGTARTDFIEASVIDARLRDLQAQRRVLFAEQHKQGNGPRNAPPE
jgi:beta-barrel assembly-enhancing protease